MDDENDLDNIFEEYENKDVQESNTEPQNEENSANAESNEAQTREVVPVPKRIIRNPRLKFNADRLCGERGIPIVTKHFKNVKFKGKGHEKEDLNKLLSALEHWSHRLFPSMKFEACLKQIEKLGKKRAVQTCLAKIRKDMPILSSDFVHDDEDIEREGAQNEADFELPPQDAFDTIFGESRDTEFTANLTSTPRNPASSGVVLGTSFGGSLTEEQRQRMEYNKMLATERRKAKMAAMQADEDSGRTSPSVLEPEMPVSNPALESPDLDQQFESLFNQPIRKSFVLEDLKKKGCESMGDDSENNPMAYEDTEMNQQQSTSQKKGCESMGDDSENNPLAYGDTEMNQQQSTSQKKECESMGDDSENNPLAYEDTEMNQQQSTRQKKGCESVGDDSENNPLRYEDTEMNQQQSTSQKKECESMGDDSENNPLAYEDTEMNQQQSTRQKKGCESMGDDSENNPLRYEDTEMNQQQSTRDESGRNLRESAHDSKKDLCESACGSLEDNHQDLEKSHCELTLPGDSVTNPYESIDDISTMDQCESKTVTEELGLDELMDLVDEDDTTST